MPFELADNFVSISSTRGQFGSFGEISKAHGFSTYVVLNVTKNADDTIAVDILATNIFKVLIDDLNRGGGLGDSALVGCMASSNLPFMWRFVNESVQENGGSVDDRMAAYCASLDLRFGFAVPIQLSKTNKNVVVYFTDSMDMNDRRPELVLDTLEHFHLSFKKSAKSQSLDFQPLSRLELSCVRWAAQGKSNSEISYRLSLSERATNHLFEAAVRKLGAKDRTHAVVKAMEAALI